MRFRDSRDVVPGLAVTLALLLACPALADEATTAEQPHQQTVEDADPRFGAYGLGSQDYWIAGSQFAPSDGSRHWSDANDGLYYHNPHASTGLYTSQVELPAGAVISSMECLAYDSSSSDATVSLVKHRYHSPDDIPSSVSLATIDTEGTSGYQKPFVFGLNETVRYQEDSFRNIYGLSALMPADPGVRLRGCRLIWHRSVSVAPGAATFDDVPTTHPQFRFVEALAAAGITGGCGASSFCPGAPLTRGQMAVFLAAALGLHFPF